MVILESRKLESYLKLCIGVVILILLNLLSSRFYHRFDLTEEGRYTIKPATKQMLKQLDDVVYIEVYLDGELNSGFKRLQRSVRETLEEFRIYSGDNIQYTFTNPEAALSSKAKNEFMSDLSRKGIQPTNIIDTKNGEKTERLIFPGALISYGGQETGVMLLKGNQTSSAEEKLNQSIEGIEYALASGIDRLTNIQRIKLGIVRGHGELDSLEFAGFQQTLAKTYDLEEIHLGEGIPRQVAALVIAKPKRAFQENEKYNLDQYIMGGGKALMLIDKLQADMDSASNEYNFAFNYDLNLDDQLFKYGIRINNDLVQDRSAARYPVVVGQMGDQPQIQLMEWPFFPILNRFGDHPITRNLNAIEGRFISSIDTIQVKGVRKTPLVFTSNYSRTINSPVKVSIQDLQHNLTPEMLNKSNIPVAYLLEGNFISLYKNRFKPDNVSGEDFRESSLPGAKLLVIGDGDIARNDINPRNNVPQALGYDPILKITFGNEDFLMNALNYLIQENGLITARNKRVEIRPLDEVKIANTKLTWQLINLALPVGLIILFGTARYFWRKRKYTRFPIKP